MEYTAFVTLPMNGQISVGPAIFPAFGTIGKIAAVIMFEVAVVPEAQIVLNITHILLHRPEQVHIHNMLNYRLRWLRLLSTDKMELFRHW